jgi:hypothetical protein
VSNDKKSDATSKAASLFVVVVCPGRGSNPYAREGRSFGSSPRLLHPPPSIPGFFLRTTGSGGGTKRGEPSELRLIGKESNALEATECGLIGNWDDILSAYGNRTSANPLSLELLMTAPAATLAKSWNVSVRLCAHGADDSVSRAGHKRKEARINRASRSASLVKHYPMEGLAIWPSRARNVNVVDDSSKFLVTPSPLRRPLGCASQPQKRCRGGLRCMVWSFR